MNIFHFGIGPDVVGIVKALENTGDINYFIDPELLNYNLLFEHKGNAEYYATTIEGFFESMTEKILGGELSFERALIKTDRMIEHIGLNELLTFVFPLFRRLITECGCAVEITYPNIDKVSEYLRYHKDFLSHQLCNIEAIAFGSHKVIFNDDIMSHYFRNIKHSISPITLDKKPFYSRMSLNLQGRLDEDYERKECEPFSGAKEIISDNHFVLSDDIWSLSNDLKISPNPEKLFFFKYRRDNNQSEECLLVESKKITSKHQILEDIITREGFFKVTDHSYRFNRIHPYLNCVTFMQA